MPVKKPISRSLRKKTLLLVSALLLSLIVSLYLLSRVILLNTFRSLEDMDTREHVQRVQSALDGDLAALAAIAGDWGPWTDSYTFVQGSNKTYVEQNLMDSTFANLQINLMVFVDTTGRVVYAKNYDMVRKTSGMVPPELLDQLTADHPLFHYASVYDTQSGIVLLPEAPLLVASAPIVTSEFQGPAAGTLIVGRFLDAATVAELNEHIHLSFTVVRLDSRTLTPEIRQAYSALSEKSPIFIHALNGQTIAGYSLLKDMTGQPALVVKVERPRSIYLRGQDTLSYLIFSVVVTGLAFSIAILLLLEGSVLARLADLTNSMVSIGRGGDPSARVTVPRGSDELTHLAVTINETLEALQKSESQLHHSTLLLKEIHHRVKNNLQVISSLLTLQTAHTADPGMMQILKDSHSRIQSMALVHEKLYSSDRPGLVDLGDYTRSLAEMLGSSAGSSGAVRVSVSAENVILDTDQAVPVGLILNELISNAFKHAFPNGRAGEIQVELRADGKKQVTIRVRDDGVGFPVGLDIAHSPTLGLQLIQGLTRQLHGTVEFRQDGGTVVEVRFGQP